MSMDQGTKKQQYLVNIERERSEVLINFPIQYSSLLKKSVLGKALKK